MREPPARLAIGMMSGTSADGVDAVMLRTPTAGTPELLAHWHSPYPPELRSVLLQVAHEGHVLSTRQLAALDADVGAHYAACARQLIDSTGMHAADVTVLGMHGQTIAHDPPGNSLQIGNPVAVAQATGIPVVADLRRGDMALGGQGAPLVPAFHAAAFGDMRMTRVVINIGGIANLSWLPPRGQGPVRGFDTGPGNTLLDAWCQRHTGAGFDAGGHWATTGQRDDGLLRAWLHHPYFDRPAPKSTGLGDFNLDALFALAAPTPDQPPENVQATLLALTARSIATGVRLAASGKPGDAPAEVFLCGGGAYNDALVDALREALAPIPVQDTSALGIPPEHVEAAAFAWLALRRQDGLPGTLASVTGATVDAVTGALYLPPQGPAT